MGAEIMLDRAKYELDLLLKKAKEKDPDDDMQEWMNNNLLEVLKVISEQGHSGFSIQYFKSMLNRLIDGKPLTPLTGEDDEWIKLVPDDDTLMNKRCCSVFKYEDGIIKNIDSVMVSDDGGHSWFNSAMFNDLETVSFPYMPPDEPIRKYIEYIDEERTQWEDITDDKIRIKELYEMNIKKENKE